MEAADLIFFRAISNAPNFTVSILMHRNFYQNGRILMLLASVAAQNPYFVIFQALRNLETTRAATRMAMAAKPARTATHHWMTG